MKELHVARRALVKDRVAARNRGHTHRSALLKRQARARLAQIDRQIAAIDAALHAELAADPALQARFDILVSIPGVGEATAFALLVEMPELGALAHKGAASLAGLAPIARDSGQHRGKRCIRGGRAPLRQALYMPALVAVRFNATMRGQIPRPPRRRQTAQSRPRRDHAQAPHPRQRPPARRPHLDPNSRLTNTDTLGLTPVSRAGRYRQDQLEKLRVPSRSSCDRSVVSHCRYARIAASACSGGRS